MFDKEKYTRCKAKFDFEELTFNSEGYGFCPTCEARVNPAKEEKRKWPVDGEQMKKELVYGRVLLDKCPKCGGKWIDGDEIEIIKKAIASLEGFKVYWPAILF